ncbi:hypothetical protein [Burkholderia cenocepacia]|uniref:hypothetical protein n=1 Tax=Burkholderia cenocepacia TaxID=95486 RepID=UPI001B9694FB|nr:hypothetical protein [Burkholderia cenocepacia]MBR8135168.1 hypothetical protein [Burkholderia cenocepacia]
MAALSDQSETRHWVVRNRRAGKDDGLEGGVSFGVGFSFSPLSVSVPHYFEENE